MASDGDFLIFEGNRYSRKGFLFKSFAMSAVVSVAPCLDPAKTHLLSPPNCFPSCVKTQTLRYRWERGWWEARGSLFPGSDGTA